MIVYECLFLEIYLCGRERKYGTVDCRKPIMGCNQIIDGIWENDDNVNMREAIVFPLTEISYPNANRQWHAGNPDYRIFDSNKWLYIKVISNKQRKESNTVFHLVAFFLPIPFFDHFISSVIADYPTDSPMIPIKIE